MADTVLCTCGTPAALATGADVYPHRADLHSKRFWVCPSCPDSYVGCHPGTTEALGTPANAETRRARGLAHQHFDRIWNLLHEARARVADFVDAVPPEPAGSSHDPSTRVEAVDDPPPVSKPETTAPAHTTARDPQAPATRAELEELRREVLETVAEALAGVTVPLRGQPDLARFPDGFRELADELRRRVARLEQLTGFAPKE